MELVIGHCLANCLQRDLLKHYPSTQKWKFDLRLLDQKVVKIYNWYQKFF